MIETRIGLGLTVIILLSGCATSPPRSATTISAGVAMPVEAPDRRWYSSCFRMPFDKQGEPVWATDLVIADRIVAPILQTHARDITLWRFHRRAAADAAGHQFSLLVFTQPMVYAAIQQAIEVSPAVESLKASGHLREIRHDCQRAGQANGIAATIDQQWDPVLQRAWPYFIMGVSASWLAMVQELALGIEANSTELIDAYRSVDAQITKLWGLQGQHAFLHHLNGIYGYRPLSIQHWMQF